MVDSINIKPIGAFDATLSLPGSKSLTNRALLLAVLAEGQSRIWRPLLADDTQYMLAALRSMGFVIASSEPSLVAVTGRGGAVSPGHVAMNLGNAGTAYRFLVAACCLWEGEYLMDGVERKRHRPIGQLVDALRQIGGRIDYKGQSGFPPLCVHGGGLRGGTIAMPPTLSSQYISALLQVGPYCEKGLVLQFDGPVTSRPYVEMTLRLMELFGVVAEVDAEMTAIHVPRGRYRATEYMVEPDASSASYFLAAAAATPGARCTIQGLGRGSLQGDIGFADVLHQMGAGLVFGNDFVTVISPSVPADERANINPAMGGSGLRGIDIDLNHMPDMALTLAAIAVLASGPTTIRHVGNLRVKETDRLAALQTELKKLGAKVAIDGDDLHIVPPADGRISPPLAGIDTYEDHRMAMSFAVLGLRLPGIVINDPACVNKTFPDFFEYLEGLSAFGPASGRAPAFEEKNGPAGKLDA